MNTKYPFEQLIKDGRITIPVPEDTTAKRYRCSILIAARHHKIDVLSRIRGNEITLVYMGDL